MSDIAADKSSPIIEMRGVNKWFDKFHVLKDIDLSVRKGERVVVCGPSGSGKSTLIRCDQPTGTNTTKAPSSHDGIELNDTKNAAIRRASRHGVPAVQPFSAPVRAGEPRRRKSAPAARLAAKPKRRPSNI